MAPRAKQEKDAALTGDGQARQDGGADPQLDPDVEVDPSANEPVEPHPEPTPIGFVQQDNVSEPGVQVTKTLTDDGTHESRHGEPLPDDADADGEGSDDEKE